jgi:competence protein ComEA
MKSTSNLIRQAALSGLLVLLLSGPFSAVSWAVQGAPQADATAGQQVAQKINVNTAGIAELTTLPGIGQKLAERIIAQRQAAGPFKSPEDLLKVKGIGEKNLKKVADLISFE